MHDLVAAQDIVKAVLHTAKENNLKTVDTVTVRLGKIVAHNEELSPENLLFNFDLVKKNTIAEKAELVIKPGKGRELTITEVQGKKD